jgi:hypothetical protein
MITRLIVVSLAAFIALFAVAASTYAFECYNSSRSDQGNASAANAPALQSLAEILADPEVVGLCPDGVEAVLAGLEEAGYDTDIVIHWRTLMAQGLEKNGKGEDLLHNGKGIDHLDEEFFATVDPLIGAAFALCE